jgi:hypothetical protein
MPVLRKPKVLVLLALPPENDCTSVPIVPKPCKPLPRFRLKVKRNSDEF